MTLTPHPAGSPPSAVPPATSPAPQARTPFWDNGRFLLMVLVVLGHALSTLNPDSKVIYGTYVLIYAFHMPAFAVLSGYFSRSTPPSRQRMARLFTDLLLPYLIFDTGWYVILRLIRGEATFDPTAAEWTLWYLLALALFRVTLPYLAVLRWPLAWTLVISVVVGYLPAVNTTFSLSRAFALLPFFTLGWWVREKGLVSRWHLLDRQPRWVPFAAVAVLAAAGWIGWFFADFWREFHLIEWLYYRSAYPAMGVDDWWAGGIRLLMIGAALLLMAAFFALVPRGRHRWTPLGAASMYIYLLHTLVLFGLRETGVLRAFEPAWLLLPGMVLGSVAICLILASKPVRAVFGPLVEPRPAALFTDPTLIRHRR
ncbi:MAG: acyltransferase family protein [Propioniciclava sp.]